MFLLEHLDLISKLIKNQNVKKLEIQRMVLRPHPKCQDFPPIRQNVIFFRSTIVNVKKICLLSQSTSMILKRFRRRSFYKSVEIVSEIENLTERNAILQILYSVATYNENNHSMNLLKIWIDDIYIKKIINTNQFINVGSQDSQCNYNITIKLASEYQAPPSEKEPLW